MAQVGKIVDVFSYPGACIAPSATVYASILGES